MRKQLIALEGIDGTGKTTAAKALASLYNFKYLKIPDGKLCQLREHIDSQESFMTRFLYYMACNSDAQKTINSILTANDLAIDRYYHSTLAYHNILLGKDMGYYLEDLNLRKADNIFLLAADKETVKDRISRRPGNATDSKLEKDIDFLMRVQDEFFRICPAAHIIDTSVLDEQGVIEYIKTRMRYENGIRNKSQDRKCIVAQEFA